MQGTSFHSPFSCQIITTQSSPAEKKLSGWLGLQFSYCCQERTVLHLRLGPGLSYSLLHPHPTSLQQSLWVASTALHQLFLLPGTQPAFLKAVKTMGPTKFGIASTQCPSQAFNMQAMKPFPLPPKSCGAPGSPGSARQTSGSRSPQLCH